MDGRDMTQFDKFRFKIRNPLFFLFFMFTKLPSAFFAGLRIHGLTENACYVTIRHKWFTKNPFKSIYFACLGMAAELSTGVLAMAYCYGKKPAVSMLVTKIEATFSKKAKGKITFKCEDGERMATAIEDTIRHGKAATVNAYAYGKDEAGDEVARFIITWSFRSKL
jgi:hypothetical protein